MLAWLSDNMVNIIIVAILVLVVGLLIRGMIRDRKAGKSSCGGNCASCGACCAHSVVWNSNRQDGNVHMIRTRVAVEGMMCGMCEAHINDAVRKAIPVKKVSSSHTRGETVIITESVPDTDLIRKAIDSTGYKVLSVESTPANEKKNLRPSFG